LALLGRFRFCGVLLRSSCNFRYLPICLAAQLQLSYGIVIFAYMSGTHWNFAARYEQGESPAAYIFAVMPALLLFAVMVFVPSIFIWR
jgi:hypothetical protein